MVSVKVKVGIKLSGSIKYLDKSNLFIFTMLLWENINISLVPKNRDHFTSNNLVKDDNFT